VAMEMAGEYERKRYIFEKGFYELKVFS